MATKSKAKDDLFAEMPPLKNGDTLVIESTVSDDGRHGARRTNVKASVRPKGRKSEVAVLPPPKPQNMLAIIAAAAANPAVDTAKMQALLAMQERIVHDEREQAFNAAMHAAQSEMPRIARDKKADRFSYATLENVSREIDPVARKHGFVLSYGTNPPTVPGNIAMYVDVMHTGGCVRRYSAPELKPDTTGLKDGKNKTDTQGSGASISYMRRYLKCMVFDVIIAGEDIDGAKAKPKVEVITEEQFTKLAEICEAVECPRERLAAHLGVKNLGALPAKRFDEAVTALANFDVRRKEREAAEKGKA